MLALTGGMTRPDAEDGDGNGASGGVGGGTFFLRIMVVVAVPCHLLLPSSLSLLGVSQVLPAAVTRVSGPIKIMGLSAANAKCSWTISIPYTRHVTAIARVSERLALVRGKRTTMIVWSDMI